MYADGELPGREAASVERHAAGCAACRAQIEALRAESVVLRTALRQADELAPIPRFAPPPRARDFVVLALTVVLIGGFSKAFWNTVAAALPTELTWLSPLKSGTLFERAVDIATFTVYEAPAMWTAITNFIGAALVLAFVAWLAFSAVRPRAFAGLAAALLAVAFALPSPGHALELRRSNDAVTVAADETIDDTVFVMARIVSVDGTINGDLIALGQEVTVRGNVTGNLVTGAQSVTIEGTVGGTVIGGAEGLSVANARIGRDLYGFANDVDIAAGTNVSGNATTFAETVDLDGRVGIDFRGFARTLNVSGAVEGDVEGYADSIAVLSTARIGGNVTGHVDQAGDLDVSSGAVVGGNVDERLVEREQRRNRYLTVGYYVDQIVRLGAAFLAGLLLLWLFPVLRSVSPDATAVVRSAGIGLAAAVTLPIAALILCVTIVGLPLGVLTFVAGAVALYFSKIVVAEIIGRAVLRDPESPPHFAATLITGLIIVIVAINVPFIGGVINFALTLIGLGIIVSLVLARFNRGTV
jgi:hypothetical protein